jgi:hypothetical protein
MNNVKFEWVSANLFQYPPKMLPTVIFNEDNGYTFTLWRDGNKIVHEFKKFSVTIDENHETIINGFSSVAIHGIHEQVILPEDHTRIGGPPCDGVFYYICAVPYSGEDLMVWLSKEEYDILLPTLHDIQDERYYKDYECEFTSTTINDCIKNPQNYGPEQRARIMAYTYKHESDGDEECDYCHGPVGRCGSRCRDSDLYY